MQIGKFEKEKSRMRPWKVYLQIEDKDLELISRQMLQSLLQVHLLSTEMQIHLMRLDKTAIFGTSLALMKLKQR